MNYPRMLPDDSSIAIHRRHIRRQACFSGVPILILVLVAAGWAQAFDRASPGGPIREVRAGLAAHDVDGLWSQASKEEGLDLIAEIVFSYSLFRLHSVSAHPNLGVSLNSRGDTSKAYGGFLLQWEPASRFFFSTGVGLALHNGKLDTDAADQKSLGSRLLFRVPIEIGYTVSRHHRIILAFDHISNAGLASPNQGLDTLGLVYGFRF